MAASIAGENTPPSYPGEARPICICSTAGRSCSKTIRHAAQGRRPASAIGVTRGAVTNIKDLQFLAGPIGRFRQKEDCERVIRLEAQQHVRIHGRVLGHVHPLSRPRRDAWQMRARYVASAIRQGSLPGEVVAEEAVMVV